MVLYVQSAAYLRTKKNVSYIWHDLCACKLLLITCLCVSYVSLRLTSNTHSFSHRPQFIIMLTASWPIGRMSASEETDAEIKNYLTSLTCTPTTPPPPTKNERKRFLMQSIIYCELVMWQLNERASNRASLLRQRGHRFHRHLRLHK